MIVDLDELTAAELAELASVRRLQELTPPWSRSIEEDSEAAEAFERLRRPTSLSPGPGEWLADDPRRLRPITFEIARFCKDDQRVAEAVLTLAKTLKIDLEFAAGIVGSALRDARFALRKAQ
jgi:hypothetical protein